VESDERLTGVGKEADGWQGDTIDNEVDVLGFIRTDQWAANCIIFKIIPTIELGGYEEGT
jgi:hypothetical protein